MLAVVFLRRILCYLFSFIFRLVSKFHRAHFGLLVQSAHIQITITDMYWATEVSSSYTGDPSERYVLYLSYLHSRLSPSFDQYPCPNPSVCFHLRLSWNPETTSFGLLGLMWLSLRRLRLSCLTGLQSTADYAQ